jgi:hypothetical protein
MIARRARFEQRSSTVSVGALALVLALCGGLSSAQTEAPAPPTQEIVSISVCSPTPSNDAGTCPSGTFDTHRMVLGPNGSSINEHVASGTSDEHASVFAPGALQGNADYLFFVAAGTGVNSNIGAVVLSGGSGPDENGQWTFDIPITDSYGQYGSGFGHVLHAPIAEGRCPLLGHAADQDATFDLEYAAPGSIVKDPTSGPGSLLMVYEGVNPCAGCTDGTKDKDGVYISLGVATSVDYGHSWAAYRGSPTFDFVELPKANKTQGPNAPAGALGSAVCMGNDCTTPPPAAYGRYLILSPPASLPALMATGQHLSTLMANGEPSAFLDDVGPGSAPYLYIVHGYKPGKGWGNPSLPDGRSNDLMIARGQLNGGAVPLSFVKWDGTAWASPGIGGMGAQIVADGSYRNCGDLAQDRSAGSISYVIPTHQYLLTFVCASPTDPASGQGAGKATGAAWFYSTSYDLSDPSQWSSPQEIIGSWDPFDDAGCNDWKGFYPTFMSLGRKPGHLWANGYVFYLWGCLGGSDTGHVRKYSSRAFSITLGPIPRARRHLGRAA